MIEHQGPIDLENILELISVAQEELRNPERNELYLTECDKCCSRAGSYRLFSAIPDFRGNQHPDTGPNGRIMLYRTYHQDEGLAERIAKIISSDAIQLSSGGAIPEEAIAYRLK